MKKFLVTLVLLMSAITANANSVSFSGDFSSNADSRTFSISFPMGSLGGSIYTFDSADGLDPFLSLFDSGMNLLATDDDSGPGLEAFLSDANEPFLPIGNYFLTLSVSNDGRPFMMFDEPLNWNLVFENNSEYSSVSEVPVPAAAWLFASGALGLFGFKRKSLA